ncbi:hypothetical protein [Pseudogracilibacillus auburnensis]|uniref:hypothetical protein n=1 Tax=Pseudogracilibacillus auburnensis TaxID=1494959 RepID=UPI001A96BE4F|nr:hypothetical protein [Pseudogracilibacillus auburnensis]MBO1003141.1 hypothetical protein [Pseudogracilibacillus auburnensis]
MSKERLELTEAIKALKDYQNGVWIETHILEKCLEIVIDQAERVQELENELKQCKDYMAESTNYLNFATLKKQNKRYRVAIKETISMIENGIGTKDNPTDLALYDVVDIIAKLREVTEGES